MVRLTSEVGKPSGRKAEEIQCSAIGNSKAQDDCHASGTQCKFIVKSPNTDFSLKINDFIFPEGFARYSAPKSYKIGMNRVSPVIFNVNASYFWGSEDSRAAYPGALIAMIISDMEHDFKAAYKNRWSQSHMVTVRAHMPNCLPILSPEKHVDRSEEHFFLLLTFHLTKKNCHYVP